MTFITEYLFLVWLLLELKLPTLLSVILMLSFIVIRCFSKK